MLDEKGSESQAGPESDEGSGGSREPGQQFPVVAVGASAGGLEALTGLLRHLPADTGMAFVVIQHLDPHHESILAQLLSRETAMPVSQANDGTTLSPNQVYVIPPNAGMTISGLALTLTPREGGATAVDGFLRSLAASRRNTAVAIILSGTGSDGALGVQAIAEEGGIVFAQEPASARFDGMPRSAIDTGCVDFILAPDEIAAEVARIAREPRLIEREPREISQRFPVSESEKDLETLFKLLRAGTGIEFNLYRQSTFRRRLVRRLALLKIGSLAEYVEYAREHSDELHALAQDVLIRVTHFFRDADAFDALSGRVFPALIRKASKNGAVRIWVPGCSTGEEAYSIAICFLEASERMHSPIPCKIFATDINEAAIGKARRGVYVENIVADVSPERLERFFVRSGREFQVGKRLRELCIFSRHDLLNDPPFSRMDLVSCRNVLIYLDSIQERVLTRFHFALNPGGYLLLGKSERADGQFTPVDTSARLYVRQESVQHVMPVQAIPNWPSLPRVEAGGFEGVRPPSKIDLWRLADRVLTDRYAPPRVIVNGELEGLDSGGAAVFSNASPVDPAAKLLESAKIAQPDALREAIRKAAGTGESIRIEEVTLGDGASTGPVSIEVTPVGPGRQHFLIVFEELDAPPAEARTSESPTREPQQKFEMRIRGLEKELAASRGRLESVTGEHEAANEEAVAANEELQSLNEELASSKEEIESANEELTTINQELQIRNGELENAREFAQATIDTVRSSLLVLGPGLRVERANRSFYRIFRLSPEEVEHQFIYELGDRVFGNSRLRELLEEILPKNRVMDDFEIEYPNLFGSQRVLVMNARRFESDERILLAIEDMTESRHAEAELRQSQKMEAIGYLAAGVAHDFNNLLTGVIGNASLVLDALPEGDPGRVGLENVISGGERAADLTRQLLAYAGKGRFYLERVDLSEVVIQTGTLIHPSIPTKVQLRLELDRDLPPLLADPAQIQQVVMNLLINAAESIGGAGLVVVKTGRQTVTLEGLPGSFSGEKVAPGQYVFLEVLDNGAGMDKQTIERIFDPFFSTKFTGRGLGLAAVLGIVRQYKGGIQIHSFPGRGSSFRVLFSIAEHVPPKQVEGKVDLSGAGTVLAVDDEEIIRKFTRSALEMSGYRVLLARDGSEGVRMFRDRSAEIRLVLLDLAMPGMDGVEVLKWIRKINPDVPVVICTGFGDKEAEKRFEGMKISGIFQKPYTAKQLLSKVKECIAPAEPAKSETS